MLLKIMISITICEIRKAFVIATVKYTCEYSYKFVKRCSKLDVKNIFSARVIY